MIQLLALSIGTRIYSNTRVSLSEALHIALGVRDMCASKSADMPYNIMGI